MMIAQTIIYTDDTVTLHVQADQHRVYALIKGEQNA